MIDLALAAANPAFTLDAHLSRAYVHALLGAPNEPIAAMIAAMGEADGPNQRITREDGTAATVAVARREPRFVRPLTIADNLMLAFASRGLDELTGTAATHGVLTQLDALALADAYPDQVPLGVQRLIAAERDLGDDHGADLVVIDDLLHGLPDEEQARVMAWVRTLTDRVEGVLVVHTANPVFAMGLADRVLMVDQGKIAQHDTVHGIVRKPVNNWAGDKLTNVYRGTFTDGILRLDNGRRMYTHVVHDDGPVLVTVHPRSVLIHREKPEGSALNVWHGRVAGLEPAGNRVRVNMLGLTPLVAEVTVNSCRRLDLPVGGPIWASFKASRVDIHPLC